MSPASRGRGTGSWPTLPAGSDQSRLRRFAPLSKEYAPCEPLGPSLGVTSIRRWLRADSVLATTHLVGEANLWTPVEEVPSSFALIRVHVDLNVISSRDTEG